MRSRIARSQAGSLPSFLLPPTSSLGWRSTRSTGPGCPAAFLPSFLRLLLLGWLLPGTSFWDGSPGPCAKGALCPAPPARMDRGG
eukprot:10432603-Heterocapsa_arctica.AAC.1